MYGDKEIIPSWVENLNTFKKAKYRINITPETDHYHFPSLHNPDNKKITQIIIQREIESQLNKQNIYNEYLYWEIEKIIQKKLNDPYSQTHTFYYLYYNDKNFQPIEYLGEFKLAVSPNKKFLLIYYYDVLDLPITQRCREVSGFFLLYDISLCLNQKMERITQIFDYYVGLANQWIFEWERFYLNRSRNNDDNDDILCIKWDKFKIPLKSMDRLLHSKYYDLPNVVLDIVFDYMNSNINFDIGKLMSL